MKAKYMLLVVVVALVLTSLFVLSTAVVQAQVDYPIGPEALKQGVISYKSVKTYENGFEISFQHLEPYRSGSLTIIEPAGKNGKVKLELKRENGGLTIDWNRETGKTVVKDSQGNVTSLAVKDVKKGWELVDNTTREVLDRNSKDVELMFALGADFAGNNSTNINQSRSCSSKLDAVMSVSCNYSLTITGTCVHWTKSLCCECANGEVAYQCWNGACIGCCQLIGECDSYCIAGDYDCICSRSGYPCKYP